MVPHNKLKFITAGAQYVRSYQHKDRDPAGEHDNSTDAVVLQYIHGLCRCMVS